MHVIATAGHVDHGKSALVRALTGMEPDRWEEERRRGLTIDLGFAWTDGVAFVDVPGHERFVGNMLAGVGPVPACLFVVAADEGWRQQSAEHLLALHALDVRHGILAVTKADLVGPSDVADVAVQASEHIRQTSLGQVPVVAVSARTGAGLAELRHQISELADRLPPVDPAAPIRLWVDRAFTVRGSGLVVTGTLAAGTIHGGDTLDLVRTGERFTVREIQTLNRRVRTVSGVARVALNLRGPHRTKIVRGDALATAASYECSTTIDARLTSCSSATLPRQLLVHAGTATTPCTVRPLGADTARLGLADALPLRLGDRLVLRNDRGVAGGAVVLDIDPPAMTRRGAARHRAEELAAYALSPEAELDRRGIIRGAVLRRRGLEPPVAPLVGDWVVAPALDAALRATLADMLRQRRIDPATPPLPVADAQAALGLPDVRLVTALVEPPYAVRAGAIMPVDAPDALAPTLRDALAALEPLRAFTEQDIGLGPAELAAATRAGRLLRLAPGVIVAPALVEHAVTILTTLDQPFTAAAAREALGTPRKVAIALLEHLARGGRTRRDSDGRHRFAVAQ